MNNERFNHIEEKIREAAINAEPPFDEMAWQKMEAKLDSEKDRRRPFFWWLFISIAVVSLSSAVIYFSTRGDRLVESHSVAVSISSGDLTRPGIGNASEKNSRITNKHSPNSKAQVKPALVIRDETGGATVTTNNRPPKINRSNVGSARKPVAKGEPSYGNSSMVYSGKKKSDAGRAAVKVKSPAVLGEDTGKAPVDLSVISPNSNNADPVNEFFGKENLDKKADELIDSLSEKEQLTSKTISDSIPAMRKKKHSRGFYLTASAGPEITGVSGKSVTGKDISSRFGVGLGYQLNRKWSVQTGFYSVAKKYVAGKEDYNPKDDAYISGMNNLSVDANCRVFELPLSLRYSFTTRKTYSFFMSAGVAGVIMKREDYEFTYTRGTFPYIGTYTDEKAFTGNRHFLAFAQFSGGISKKINNSFSFVAEPYVTLPLHGVGEGRVKLFSAGLQLGIKFKPSKN